MSIFKGLWILTSIFQILEQKEDFEHGEPQNEKQIKDLEDKLDVKFPESYKTLLRVYGYMAWFGGAIYGPSKDEYYDVITRNKEARDEVLPENFEYPPNNAFLIKDFGEAYLALFSADSLRAGQVGLFLSETGYREEQTWKSLEAFLEDYYCS